MRAIHHWCSPSPVCCLFPLLFFFFFQMKAQQHGKPEALFVILAMSVRPSSDWSFLSRYNIRTIRSRVISCLYIFCTQNPWVPSKCNKPFILLVLQLRLWDGTPAVVRKPRRSWCSDYDLNRTQTKLPRHAPGSPPTSPLSRNLSCVEKGSVARNWSLCAYFFSSIELPSADVYILCKEERSTGSLYYFFSSSTHWWTSFRPFLQLIGHHLVNSSYVEDHLRHVRSW
jgi:hypothetical protein